MKMRCHLVVAVLLVMLAISCSKEESIQADIPVVANVKAMENELLSIVNEHRTSAGYSSLEFSVVAYEYANSHTDYMIAQGILSHDNFSARASVISSETNAVEVAENVAKDHPSAAAAFDGWLNSPSHKKTMEGDFTHTAVSVKKDANGDLYFTQLFYR